MRPKDLSLGCLGLGRCLAGLADTVILSGLVIILLSVVGLCLHSKYLSSEDWKLPGSSLGVGMGRGRRAEPPGEGIQWLAVAWGWGRGGDEQPEAYVGLWVSGWKPPGQDLST